MARCGTCETPIKGKPTRCHKCADPICKSCKSQFHYLCPQCSNRQAEQEDRDKATMQHFKELEDSFD